MYRFRGRSMFRRLIVLTIGVWLAASLPRAIGQDWKYGPSPPVNPPSSDRGTGPIMVPIDIGLPKPPGLTYQQPSNQPYQQQYVPPYQSPYQPPTTSQTSAAAPVGVPSTSCLIPSVLPPDAIAQPMSMPASPVTMPFVPTTPEQKTDPL